MQNRHLSPDGIYNIKGTVVGMILQWLHSLSLINQCRLSPAPRLLFIIYVFYWLLFVCPSSIYCFLLQPLEMFLFFSFRHDIPSFQ
jgi:hypothetical protein